MKLLVLKLRTKIKRLHKDASLNIGGAAGNRTPVRKVTGYPTTSLGHLGFETAMSRNNQNDKAAYQVNVVLSPW